MRAIQGDVSQTQTCNKELPTVKSCPTKHSWVSGFECSISMNALVLCSEDVDIMLYNRLLTPVEFERVISSVVYLFCESLVGELLLVNN